MDVSSAVASIERREVGVVGEERRVGGQGAQHADVAEPAVALLEVGLEQERDVAGGGAALGHLDLDDAAGTGCPSRSRHAALAFSMRGSASLRSPQTTRRIEQPEGHAEVFGGGAEHLGGPPHRVVEVNALVPDRVPDAVGHRLDIPIPAVDNTHRGRCRGTGSCARSHRRPRARGAVCCRRPPDRPGSRASRRPRRRSSGRIPRPSALVGRAVGSAGHEVTYQRAWRERSIGSVSRDIETREQEQDPDDLHARGRHDRGGGGRDPHRFLDLEQPCGRSSSSS